MSQGFNCEGSNKETSIFHNSLTNLITCHMLVTHAHTPSCTLYCSQVRCVTLLVVWLDSGSDCVLTLPDLLLIDGDSCDISKTSVSNLSSLRSCSLILSLHYSSPGTASLMMTCLTQPTPNVLLEYRKLLHAWLH